MVFAVIYVRGEVGIRVAHVEVKLQPAGYQAFQSEVEAVADGSSTIEGEADAARGLRQLLDV